MWQWQPHVCVRAMTQHPQLFVLIFLLVVAFISRYGNSTFSTKPVVLPPMPPRRFFPFDSLVVEFPFGSISSLLELVRDDEIIFVMYYAPWCTRSMSVRWEFHKAASFMKDQVRFVAVNCWWNEGECHRKYKFISHPMLYVYHTNLDGFHYTGIPTADYFVHFLENIIYPITHLFDEKGIKKFVSLNDNAVIGYFDFNSSPQPPGYQQFYYASMRAVERSPVQLLKFGVLSSPYHNDILNMLPKSSSAVLVKHGSIISNYPETDNFTSSELMKWAFQEYQQPLVKIVTPSGSKSLQLSNEITKGPTLIMFSAHYPLFDVNQYYQMLREVSLEYSKCEMDEISNENLLYSLTHRLSSMKKLQELLTCSKQQQEEGFSSNVKSKQADFHRVVSQTTQQHFPANLPFTYLASSSSGSSKYSPPPSSSSLSLSLLVCQCCVSVLWKHLLEGHLYRNVCEVCYNSVKSAKHCHIPCNCPKGSTYKFNEDRIYSALQNKCLQFSPNYMPTHYKSVCCHQMHKVTTNSSSPFSPSFSFPLPPSPSYHASSNIPPSTKTANKSPSSKEFLTTGQAQDPVNSSGDGTIEDPFILKVLKNQMQQLCDHYNLQFVQGVPFDTNFNVLSLTLVKNFSGLSCRTNKTVHFYAMDLINHWMFADKFGVNSTELLETKQPAVVIIDMEDEKSYILKKPFSKTSVAEFVLNYTEGHLEREMLTAHVDTRSNSGFNCSLNPEHCDQQTFDPLSDSESKYLYITEVTAHTFHQIVLNTSKDVLLLYYAPWCGFCASFAHIYLSLAKYFRAATSLLFARINGDTEDLPWEYTADTYPTLLFFPSGRKEDSVVYSEDLPKTLTNLIRFVLHHATHTVSLWTDNSQQCTTNCIKTNRQNALLRISVLDREIKRLESRLTHLENSVLKRKLLDSTGKQLPASVQILGAMVTRSHWQKLVEKKKRQRSISKKLIRFLKRKDSSLNKEDLIKFMKINDLLVNHLPSL